MVPQINSTVKHRQLQVLCPDNYNKRTPCFDYISSPSHIAVGNTNNKDFTATCGTRLAASCIPGPTRGLSKSQSSFPGCKPRSPTIFVQVTGSCPCS